MENDDIDRAIKRATLPAIVKNVEWEIAHDSDGEKIIKVDFHIPESDNATPKQIAEIISAQKDIENNLTAVAVVSLPYFNILADVPTMRKTVSAKRKTPSNA